MDFELIDIFSPQCDIETFNPYEDPHNYEFPECWIIFLEMMIGYNGTGHIYDVYVCTIEYIRRYMPYYCDKTIVVEEWNLSEIKDKINSIIKSCTQEKPEDTFKELSKYFYLEFDDYQP